MQSSRQGRMMRVGIAAVVCTLVLTGGCALEDQSPPPLGGPSGFGLSVTLTATPDTLPRDGSSMSAIKVRARNEDNSPRANLRLTMSLTSGSLSTDEVTTDANGEAVLQYTAPDVNTPVDQALVGATAVSTDFNNSSTKSVRIGLNGPNVPAPSFTFTPEAPARFESVSFNASASTLGGAQCGTSCTYSWTFGNEGTGTGILAPHAFQTQGVHTVTLTVTAPSGTFASVSRTVTVGAPLPPIASFSFSPTDPQFGDVVNFNASQSVGLNGATIALYQWDFGNGATATTTLPTVSRQYFDERSYLVRLIVTDSNGVTATTTQTVTVVVP
jgi:PKD repeat protein